jgi:uncharacterized membrane-anchored protein
LFVAVHASAALADEPEPGAAATGTADAPSAADSATPSAAEIYAWQPGPKPIDLGHGVKLELPDSHVYLAQPDAGKLMEKMGNLHNEDLIGLVVPRQEPERYLVTLRYEESGHIKDDESLDAKELLDSMREGEADYNEERKKLGFPPIHCTGWNEQPHYDKQKHELIWGLIVADTTGSSVNYSTRILGRTGFVSLNLVADPEHLNAYKPDGALLLSKTEFESGKRYEDFNSSTDKVAEYGLTGLVLGGVGLGLVKVAKIGLLAKFGKGLIALLLAGKKAIVAAFVAAGAAVRGWFKKKKKEDAPA